MAFASTNIDDIFVLLAFFSDRSLKPQQVVVGQYLGIAALTETAVLCSMAALVIPPAYIGLLGLLPVGIGIGRLLRRRRGSERDNDRAAPRSGRASGALAVALVTVANGGDNIAVYTPLLASKAWPAIATFVAVFAAMTALWLWAARSLVIHPQLGPPIRRAGEALFPWVLIALGGYILYKSSALSFIGLGISHAAA